MWITPPSGRYRNLAQAIAAGAPDAIEGDQAIDLWRAAGGEDGGCLRDVVRGADARALIAYLDWAAKPALAYLVEGGDR